MPIDSATRREFLAALATAGLLTGCVAAPLAPPAGASRTVVDDRRPAPWLDRRLDGVVDIPTTGGVNVEAIAAQRPELIVTS